MDVMRDESHTTFTGALRDAIESWRKDAGWSRETAVMQIVEAHERIGGPANTGIRFNPPTLDAFERAKVNADRVFRWLDDVTKDNNTCPPNFIPSILAALPHDRCMALINHWLRPLGISCRPIEHVANGEEMMLRCFKDLVSASANAQTTVADLLDGAAPGELERAQTALCEDLYRTQNALAMVEERLLEQKS